MTLPVMDDDGYPTDETLKAIREWKYEDGYLELLTFVYKAWHWPDYIHCNRIKNDFGDDVWEYVLVTGGWSGNEDIVGALRENALFHAICWRESHRGGKHIYEVKSPTSMQIVI